MSIGFLTQYLWILGTQYITKWVLGDVKPNTWSSFLLLVKQPVHLQNLALQQGPVHFCIKQNIRLWLATPSKSLITACRRLLIWSRYWGTVQSKYFLPWGCLLLTVRATCPLWAAWPIMPTTTWWLAPRTDWPSTATISSPENNRPSLSAAPPGTIWPIET